MCATPGNGGGVLPVSIGDRGEDREAAAMLLSRVTPEQVEACIAACNTRYAGNVVGEWRVRGGVNYLSHKTPRWRGRIIVRDSRRLGARRSASGRRMPAACWHVFRDVIGEIMRVYPDAKVQTSLAVYTPGTWMDKYPATGWVNVGSVMEPRRMMDMCECSDEVRATPYSTLPPPVARGRYSRQADVHDDPAPLLLGVPDLTWIDAIVSRGVTPDHEQCAGCAGPTGSPVIIWCSPECQHAYMHYRNMSPEERKVALGSLI